MNSQWIKYDGSDEQIGRGGGGLYKNSLANLNKEEIIDKENSILEDRCHHGGCFT